MWHTYDRVDFKKLEADNLKIAEGLYKSQDGKKLFLVNSFPEGTPFYDLSDPHRELGLDPKRVFYHPFLGKEASLVKAEVTSFLTKGYNAKQTPVMLYRVEKGSLYSFLFDGRIDARLVSKQEELHKLLPKEMQGEESFLLPLNVYYFRCPVCHHLTLTRRFQNDICIECGWEDDGFMDDDDNAYSGPNYCSRRQYRYGYLNKKAENPLYHWFQPLWRESNERRFLALVMRKARLSRGSDEPPLSEEETFFMEDSLAHGSYSDLQKEILLSGGDISLPRAKEVLHGRLDDKEMMAMIERNRANFASK